MNKMSDYGMAPKKTGPSIKASEISQTKAGLPREIPIRGSKGAESQKRIEASPDRYWTPTTEIGERELGKAGNLFVDIRTKTKLLEDSPL